MFLEDWLVKINLFMDYVEKVIGSLLLSVMVISISIQIVLRYFLRDALPWVEELSTYLFIWLTFMAASAIYRKMGHIAVDFFVMKLPDKYRSLISIFNYLVISIAILLILKAALDIFPTQMAHRHTASLPFTKSFYTLPVIYFGIASFFTSLFFLISEILSFRDGKARDMLLAFSYEEEQV